MMHHEHHA